MQARIMATFIDVLSYNNCMHERFIKRTKVNQRFNNLEDAPPRAVITRCPSIRVQTHE